MDKQAAAPGEPLAAALRSRGIEITTEEAALLADALLDLVAAGVLVAGPPPPVPGPDEGADAPGGAGPGSGPHTHNMGPRNTKGQVRE